MWIFGFLQKTRGYRFLTENTGYRSAKLHGYAIEPATSVPVEKVTRKSGRPRKISERDGRALIRELQRLRLRGGDVTVKTVV